MGQTAEELRRQLDDQRDNLGRDLVAIGDRVSPGRMVERRRTAVRQSVGRARDAVMGTADTMVSTTGDRAGSALGTVSSTASSVGEVVSGAPGALKEQTQGNPFAAGLVAFGMGALVGSLLPKTRLEQQSISELQPALESAAADLGDQAQQMVGSVKDQAAEAADRLKDASTDAIESVKADATEAVDRTTEQVTGSGQDVPSPS